MMVSRLFLIAAMVMVSYQAKADEYQRENSTTASDCYLFFYWGKGPNSVAKLRTEFQLPHLNTMMPVVADIQLSATDKAFSWVERVKEPTIEYIATVDGCRVISVGYPEPGPFGKEFSLVMLAMETGNESEWFAPFFVASPELLEGQLICGKDVIFGYMASLRFSGTGAFRTHILFELKSTTPKILATLDCGRVRRSEFNSDAEYEEARKIFDVEKALFTGSIAESARYTPKE